MDLTTLQTFRGALYTLFERRADALMELTDAPECPGPRYGVVINHPKPPLRPKRKPPRFA
jgi:hypothetical protein